MRHELKTWPQSFWDIWQGNKTFDLRKDDRGFKAGDVLILVEYAPKPEKYTGRSIIAKVLYVMKGPQFGLEAGHVCMSIEVVLRSEPTA